VREEKHQVGRRVDAAAVGDSRERSRDLS